MELTNETFRREIDAAMLSYDRHVVCIFKTPDDCLEAIERLMLKAIKAYENRADGMRHGRSGRRRRGSGLHRCSGEFLAAKDELVGLFGAARAPHARVKARPRCCGWMRSAYYER